MQTSMKSSIALKVVLAIAGLMFTGVGMFSLLAPVAFVARNGVDIAGNLSLLNDVRGYGGVLLGSGIIILSGVFVRALAFTSALLGAALYLLFAIGRAVSIALDGLPTDTLVKATVVEFVVGLACLVVLLRFREKPAAAS